MSAFAVYSALTKEAEKNPAMRAWLQRGLGYTRVERMVVSVVNGASKASVTISGNTFPVKDQLRAMGGKWDPVFKTWSVPHDRAEEARRLVASAASPRSGGGSHLGRYYSDLAAQDGRRSGRRGWKPCGYPGCSPRYCDECDGAGLYGR